MKRESDMEEAQFQRVAPRRGAWVETVGKDERVGDEYGRTPQGCVG